MVCGHRWLVLVILVIYCQKLSIRSTPTLSRVGAIRNRLHEMQHMICYPMTPRGGGLDSALASPSDFNDLIRKMGYSSYPDPQPCLRQPQPVA